MVFHIQMFPAENLQGQETDCAPLGRVMPAEIYVTQLNSLFSNSSIEVFCHLFLSCLQLLRLALILNTTRPSHGVICGINGAGEKQFMWARLFFVYSFPSYVSLLLALPGLFLVHLCLTIFLVHILSSFQL